MSFQCTHTTRSQSLFLSLTLSLTFTPCSNVCVWCNQVASYDATPESRTLQNPEYFCLAKLESGMSAWNLPRILTIIIQENRIFSIHKVSVFGLLQANEKRQIVRRRKNPYECAASCNVCVCERFGVQHLKCIYRNG